MPDPAGPRAERGRALDTAALPVPTDLLVYSRAELASLLAGSTRFGRVLREEARWLHGDPGAEATPRA